MKDASLFDFSTDRWRPRPEPELVPYQAIEARELGPLLVLAPHPDDEVFGCGGTLALAAEQGAEVRVVVVSDGGVGGDAPAREAESRRAANELGGLGEHALEFWRLPDRGLRPDAALVQRIRQRIGPSDEVCVLAPSPFEVHPDHLAVCRAAIDAVALELAAGRQVRLAFFEVGQAQLCNRLIDISPVLARKQRAMQCFASQLAVQRYDQHLLALNRLRTYTLGPGVSHAEAFWLVDPAAAAEGAAGVLSHLTETFAQRLGGA